MSDMDQSQQPGMTARQAGVIRYSIIALCIAALAFIFQPFSLTLYGIGAVAVVFGGLAFNLVPLSQTGRPLKGVLSAAAIVLTILVVVIIIAIASAHLYGVYLRSV